MKKNLLVFLLFIGIWQQLHAQQFVSGDLFYEITSPTTVKLSSQNPNLSGNITIPETVDYNNQAYTITEIGDYSFYGLTITSVVIPNTVTTIGYASFSLCQSLTSIVIPNSVTTIADYAFSLAGLTSIICNASTPPTVDYATFLVSNPEACSLTVPLLSLSAYEADPIWRQSFNSIIGDGILNTTFVTACSSYTWENTNQTYTATGVYIGTTTNGVTEQLDLTILSNFINDGINYVVTSPTTVEVGLNPSATGEIVIPETVTTDCGTYSVTSIGNNAFDGSSGITNITIPNSVTSIGEYAFYYCSSLTSVIIPNSVTYLSNYSFYGCSGLTSVTISNSVTSIGEYVFGDCTNLTSVNIPNSVTHIGGGAFFGCYGLTSVTIPNSVISIEDAAFRNCTGLTSVTIPNSVSYIGGSAFRNCTGLTSVTIPNSVTSISSSTFRGCYGLTSVSIPNSVTSIDSDSFRGCYGLTSVTIPNSVTYIGSSIFRSCTGLTSVTISNSLTSISYNAFNSCTSLTSVTIPNSVTEIGDYAFANCTSLSSVTIPDSVTSIYEGAFENCTSLTSVICNVSTPINIDSTVFANVNQAACSLTVPAGSITAYQAATVWQDFIIISNNNNNNLSKVIDSQCGSTLAALSTVIVPVAVPLAQGYKYKVTNTVTNEVNYYTRRNIGTFALSQKADTGSSMAIKMSSTYSIAVAVKLNGVFSAYGEACLVNTPLLPTTKIQDALCGTTLANINSYLYLNAQVKGQNGYRYKVAQGSEERTYERIVTKFNPFQLKQLVGGAAYATTYEIAVSVFYNGVWQPYGASCTVTTPAAPKSKLGTTQCGITLNRTNSNVLTASLVSVAQAYRFEVSKGASTYTVETTSNLQRSFKMTEVPGLTLESDATYSIRVAIKANGTWQPYGTSCDVTTYGSPAPIKMAAAGAKPETVFNAVAYPNPFATAFQLKIDSASQTAVDLKVYDVMGRLIEQRKVNAAENNELELGNEYPSGLFTIILNQGVDVKTLRVIKK